MPTLDEVMGLFNEADSSTFDVRLAQSLEIQARLHAGTSDPERTDLQARRALEIWEHTAPKHPHVEALRELLAKPTRP